MGIIEADADYRRFVLSELSRQPISHKGRTAASLYKHYPMRIKSNTAEQTIHRMKLDGEIAGTAHGRGIGYTLTDAGWAAARKAVDHASPGPWTVYPVRYTEKHNPHEYQIRDARGGVIALLTSGGGSYAGAPFDPWTRALNAYRLAAAHQMHAVLRTLEAEREVFQSRKWDGGTLDRVSAAMDAAAAALKVAEAQLGNTSITTAAELQRNK